MQTVLNRHIEIAPEVCSARPRVAGARIRIQNIVLWSEQGMSPDEIVASHPQLTLADVHAALAFYFENRCEIDRQIREDDQFVSAMKSQLAAQTSPETRTPNDADSVSS